MVSSATEPASITPHPLQSFRNPARSSPEGHRSRARPRCRKWRIRDTAIRRSGLSYSTVAELRQDTFIQGATRKERTMKGKKGGKTSTGRGKKTQPDSEAALQRELKRETGEGASVVGDMGKNRNLSG